MIIFLEGSLGSLIFLLRGFIFSTSFPPFFDLGNLTSSREGKEGKKEAGDRRNKTFFVSLPPPLLSLSPSFERRGDEGGRGKLERILEGRKFADSEVNTHQIYVSHMAKEKYKWSIAKHIILFTGFTRVFFSLFPPSGIGCCCNIARRLGFPSHFSDSASITHLRHKSNRTRERPHERGEKQNILRALSRILHPPLIRRVEKTI